jgi:hypothetical protein
MRPNRRGLSVGWRVARLVKDSEKRTRRSAACKMQKSILKNFVAVDALSNSFPVLKGKVAMV